MVLTYPFSQRHCCFVARRPRIQLPGAVYLLHNCGDRRESIARDDADRQRFIDTLGETCAKTGWRVHAFVLMPDHFHIVVETPQPNLVVGMKWFLGTYTARLNRRHGQTGHLFAGRYRSMLIGDGGEYLKSACDYVHLNPARAKLIDSTQPLAEYRWSSLPDYLRAPSERASWLEVGRMLRDCGIKRDDAAGRREFAARLERLRGGESREQFQALRRGWHFGEEPHRKKALLAVKQSRSKHLYGPEVNEAAEENALEIIEDELRALGWSQEDLVTERKGHVEKVRIAQRLRAKTTMPLRWIAEKLHMGMRSHLTHLLYWSGREKPRSHPLVKKRKPRTTLRAKRIPPAAKPDMEPAVQPTRSSEPFAFDTSFD